MSDSTVKRILSGFLAAALLFSLCACAGKTKTANDEPIRMFIGLGNNQRYYESLHAVILENLGIDVQFVYQHSEDMTSTIRLEQKNGDLCADIIATASASPEEYLTNSCLDLMDHSQIIDLFTYAKIKENTCSDGGVYQLPFTSRLIGITYNKTLMEEMGWTVPTNFAEMLQLKTLCEEAGIPFAVSGSFATGHGFNYLFHLMGSQWLSELDGTEWLEEYLAGNASIDAFAEEADYFRQYAESGLFGSMYTGGWDSAAECTKQRALFYYNITCDLYSTIRYNEDGTITGAAYLEDGSIRVEADPNGRFVCYEGEWYLYSDNDTRFAGLERYDIPGALVDEYAAMPWISEDGSNNCFTYYDNMYLSLNKKLGEDGEEARLAQCLEILEFMTTESVTDIFSDLYPDGYVATKSYQINTDRLYQAYADDIQNGYLQPWYYNEFDNNTIMNTGALVNRYLAGENVSFDDILAELDRNNSNRLNETQTVLTTVEETLDYASLARLEAICGANSLQEQLDALGTEAEITVSLMPYTEQTGDLPPWEPVPAVNTKLYEGAFLEGDLGSILPSKGKSPVAVYLTGSEILALRENGLDLSAEMEYDAAYGPYPVAVVQKGTGQLEANAIYLTAVDPSVFTEAQYNAYLDAGKVIFGEDGQTPISGSVRDGLCRYFEAHPTVRPDSIVWDA